MKWLSIVMGVVFVGFTVVQFNDPDAPYWMLVYGFCSVVSFAAAFGRCPLWFAAAVGASCLVWSMTLWPSLMHVRGESFTDMHNGNITDEECRESLGLLIGATWCGAVFAWVRRRRATGVPQQAPEVPR